MLIGSLCDSGSTHSVGFQVYNSSLTKSESIDNFIVVKFHFLFRNKLILILLSESSIPMPKNIIIMSCISRKLRTLCHIESRTLSRTKENIFLLTC